MEHNGVILDRKGRPMSISDIIVMHLPNGDRLFYCDHVTDLRKSNLIKMEK